MGGNSGGGGGQSGKVEYPAYLQTLHGNWLDGGGTDTMTSSITDYMGTAVGNSPYSGLTAIDPQIDITAFQVDVEAFSTFVQAIVPDTKWEAYAGAAVAYIDASILDETTLLAEIAANDAIIDNRITTTILPRFQLGMRDMNAIMTSAFTIGQSNIEAQAQLDKDKFGADLRLMNYKQRNEMIMTSVTSMTTMLNMVLDYYKAANHYIIEAARIKNVMLTEELETQVQWDEKDVVWNMSVYQYGCNVMAAISGAAGGVVGQKPSVGQKALGGVLSGVAAGAMMSGGNPFAALAGGLIGGIGGALL